MPVSTESGTGCGGVAVIEGHNAEAYVSLGILLVGGVLALGLDRLLRYGSTAATSLTLGIHHRLVGQDKGAGRLDEAIPLFEQTLADRKQVLGDTHPDTLASRNNLATAYQAAGRLE